MKAENQFIASVHKHLPLVYREKMNNPYRRGTADVWYSGAKGDCWVEYKYVPGDIRRRRTNVPVDVTAQQLKWLSDRAREGRRVYVIVGCTEGGVMFDAMAGITPLAPSVFLGSVLSRKELADVISSITGTSPCLLPSKSSTPPKLSRRRTASSSRRCSSRR